MGKVGIVFICPIIGLTRSLSETFSFFRKRGFPVEMVDIVHENEKRSFWKVLTLVALPGAHKRRIDFGNKYDESKLFIRVYESICRLQKGGYTRIVLGGMSGGFIFASRVAQLPHDDELEGGRWQSIHPNIVGVFGVSPLLFYPAGVQRRPANPERIPTHIPVILVWGQDDQIVPIGTIEYGFSLAQKYTNITSKVLRRSDFKEKRKIRHQFFGGKDFNGPLHNIFWHAAAEKVALETIANGIPILQKEQ